MKFVIAILCLGAACSLWMLLQLWSGNKSKKDRWRGGGGCSGHAILLTMLISSFGCSNENELTQSTQHIMGTPISVTASASKHQIVFDIFRQVDNDMSEWKQESPLTQVNHGAGIKAVQVPMELYQTVKRSLEIANLTLGCFDPTWATLWKLWRFDGREVVPSQEEVNKLLPLVNWESVVLDENERSIFLPTAGELLGLGGIAKGVALDLARDALIAKGVNNFMIVAGGQVLVNGLKNGKPWRVGIRDPEKEQHEYFTVLEVTDTCISTSGNYEKFFIKDGVRYHHIIDPRTGFPARGTKSVTVICHDATLADALSTAFFVMGSDRAIQLADNLQGVEIIIIDEDNNLIFSEHAGEFLRNTNSIKSSASSELISASNE